MKNKVGRPKYQVNKKEFIKTLKKVRNNEITNVQAMQILNCRKTLYYYYKNQFKEEIIKL